MTDTATADGDGKRKRRRSNLSLAPAEKRCKALIPEDDGTHTRCSRYSILGEGGRREAFCVSHSQSRHAQDIREQRRRAQATQRRRERVQREQLAYSLLPSGVRSAEDFRSARLRIGHAVVQRTLTPPEAQALLRLVSDAERAFG